MKTTNKRSSANAQVQKVERPLSGYGAVFKFTDTSGPGSFAGAGTVPPNASAISFKLSDSTNASSYANLFQEYRITRVDYTFTLLFDPTTAGVGSATAGYLPQFVTVVDYNDATAPASQAELLSYDNAQFHILTASNPMFKISLEPRAANTVQGSNVGNVKGLWINTSNATIPHYGLKWVMTNNANVSLAIATYTKTYYEFRSPR